MSIYGAGKNAREDALRRIDDAIRRVNEAVLRAVDEGVSVELVRSWRCHDGRGAWGDQMAVRDAPPPSARH